MIASLITCVSRFLREIAHAILSKTGLFRASGKAFIRICALAVVAVLGWTGVSGEANSVVTPTGQVSIAVGVNFVPAVHAADGDGKSVAEKAGETSVQTINAVFNLMYALLTPLLMLAGWLLTPDWVFGEIFGLRPILHDMWILISNIVYVIFAFLLVAMAFMNIFGSEGNTWAIKAKLPKLIVGIISVPFTWFFVSAVVSIASVLTASAVQLAGDLAPGQLNEFELSIPPACTIDFTKSASGESPAPAAASAATADAAAKDSKTKTGTGKFLDCPESDKKMKFSELFKSNDAFGIVSYYAYGVFKIQDYKNITKDNLSTIKNALSLGVNLLIALVMFVVFFFIIIALVFALLSRALYFWAIAIFSPLLSLRYFFEGKLGGFGDKWLSVTHIIGLALVPVYVAAALSFGMIFTSMVTTTKFESVKSDYVKIEDGATKEKQVMKIFGTTYTVIGTPVGTQTYHDAKTIGGGFIGQLIMQLAALGVLWFAVMAALKGSEITKEAAAPIEKFGGEIGSLIQSLPKYAPIIPTGHGAASLNSLPRISSQVKNAVDAKYGTERANEIGGSIIKGLGLNSGFSDKLTKADTVLARMNNNGAGDNEKNFINFTANTKMEVGDYKDKTARDKLHRLVEEKMTISNPEKKKEILTMVDGLDGSNEKHRALLHKLNDDAFNKAGNVDTLDEYEKIAKGEQSGGSSTPGSASNPSSIKINIVSGAAPQSIDLKFQKDADKKAGLSDQAKTSIKSALNSVPAAEKAKETKSIREQIVKWLDDNDVKNVDDQEKILKAIDPSLEKAVNN